LAKKEKYRGFAREVDARFRFLVDEFGLEEPTVDDFIVLSVTYQTTATRTTSGTTPATARWACPSSRANTGGAGTPTRSVKVRNGGFDGWRAHD
jgi:hypothetical protein